MFIFTPSNHRPRSRNLALFYVGLVTFTVIAAVNRNLLIELLRPVKPTEFISAAVRVNRITQRQVQTEETIPSNKNTDSYEASSFAALLTERLQIPNDATPLQYPDLCKFETTTKPCQDERCHSPKQTVEERLEDLLSDKFHPSKREMEAILSLGKSVPVSDVIIASAASANHYEEMQAMFKALHEQVYPELLNFTMVLFDLGLKQHQLRMTEKNCRCKVIPLNFDIFPHHVRDLHCYSWKPLIIRAMAEKATTLIVWQDASVRWKDGFQIIFKRAALFGQQIVVTDHADRVTSNTMPEMFQYMEEDICKYHGVPELANAMALHRPDRLVVRAILDPWAKCALNASCMCPSNYNVWFIRHCVKQGGNHRCHRFDQSALTLLTAKLYGDQRYKVEIPEQHKHVKVMRGDRLKNYFRD